MHQTKKGNQWHFGMKAHIGVDVASGLVHTVVATAANEADMNQTAALLHGEEEEVFADAGYRGGQATGTCRPRGLLEHRDQARHHQSLAESPAGIGGADGAGAGAGAGLGRASLPRGQEPGLRVVSGKFSEEFGGRLVTEASQPGAVVVGDEGEQVGVTFGVIEKAAVMGGAVLRHAVEMLAEAAVEALDHAIGLRPERRVRRWVMARCAQTRSKGCCPEGLSWGLAFLSTAKRSVNSEPLSVSTV